MRERDEYECLSRARERELRRCMNATPEALHERGACTNAHKTISTTHCKHFFSFSSSVSLEVPEEAAVVSQTRVGEMIMSERDEYRYGRVRRRGARVREQ